MSMIITPKWISDNGIEIDECILNFSLDNELAVDGEFVSVRDLWWRTYTCFEKLIEDKNAPNSRGAYHMLMGNILNLMSHKHFYWGFCLPESGALEDIVVFKDSKKIRERFIPRNGDQFNLGVDSGDLYIRSLSFIDQIIGATYGIDIYSSEKIKSYGELRSILKENHKVGLPLIIID